MCRPGPGPVESRGHTETRLCRLRLLARKCFGRGQIGALTGFHTGKFTKLAEIHVEMVGTLLYNIKDSSWGILSGLV